MFPDLPNFKEEMRSPKAKKEKKTMQKKHDALIKNNS